MNKTKDIFPELQGLRICMINQGDFPPDIRVSKEASTLLKQGAEIHLICNNKFGRIEKEKIEGIFIHRLPHFKRLGRINEALRFPVFFNPLWTWKILSVIKKCQIDVIHVHDLPLVPVSLRVGKYFSIPVIYDMHENYPEALKTWKKKDIVSLLFRNYRITRIIDSWCQHRVDNIIVVIEELKDFLVKQGVSPEKIFVVPNYSLPEILNHQPIQKQILEKFRHSFNLLYTGTFGPERGLDVPILALNYIKKYISNIKLLLVGTGDNIKYLKKLAKSIGVEEKVVFTGWVDFELYRTYINIADICLVPQPSNSFINTTIPHKLFQYMCLAKVVLVSDAKPLRRIVSDANCGKIFKSNDVQDFTRAILSLQDEGIRKCLGENGKRAVEEKYNWENASVQLVDLYLQLYKRRQEAFHHKDAEILVKSTH